MDVGCEVSPAPANRRVKRIARVGPPDQVNSTANYIRSGHEWGSPARGLTGGAKITPISTRASSLRDRPPRQANAIPALRATPSSAIEQGTCAAIKPPPQGAPQTTTYSGDDRGGGAQPHQFVIRDARLGRVRFRQRTPPSWVRPRRRRRIRCTSERSCMAPGPRPRPARCAGPSFVPQRRERDDQTWSSAGRTGNVGWMTPRSPPRQRPNPAASTAGEGAPTRAAE